MHYFDALRGLLNFVHDEVEEVETKVLGVKVHEVGTSIDEIVPDRMCMEDLEYSGN